MGLEPCPELAGPGLELRAATLWTKDVSEAGTKAIHIEPGEAIAVA